MNNLLILKPEEGFPLTIQAEAIVLKNDAIANLSAITAVDTPEVLAIAANVLSNAAGIIKRMEEARVSVKAPVLDAGKRIDSMAKEYSQPVQVELDRVKRLVSDFQAKEAMRVEEENRRIEEEERRKAKEAERIRREEAVKAERERLAKEEAIRRAAEAEQAHLQEQARQAAEARKAAEMAPDDGLSALRQASAEEEEERVHVQQQAALAEEARKLAEAQEEERRILAQQEADRISEAARVSALPTVTAPKVQGVASRKVWKYEVTAPLLVLNAHPEFVEIHLRPAAINHAISTGLRECPGLRIYEDVETKVRAK